EEGGNAGAGRRQDLDRDDLSVGADRLVDAGHPTAADPFEDLVVVEEEVVDEPLREEAGLIFGDQVLADEPARELAGRGTDVSGEVFPAAARSLDLVRGQEPAPREMVAQSFDGEFHVGETKPRGAFSQYMSGHVSMPGGDRWSPGFSRC